MTSSFPLHSHAFPPPFSTHSLPFSHVPSPSTPLASPLIQLEGLRERCKLPQRVPAEPGRQAVLYSIYSTNLRILHALFKSYTAVGQI